MNNKRKVLLILIISGWIRVLLFAIPATLVYFGVTQSDVSTPTEQME
jgi:hypothetical protein